jgi:DNA-binding response OmpR family regulator
MQDVLIIDSNDQALTARGDQLLMDGYEVHSARAERDAQLKLAEGPDAVVLCSVGTPARTLALLRELRAGEIPRADPRVPVLSVGADDDSAAIRHYKAGADVALPSSASGLLVAAGLEALAARSAGELERRRMLRVGSLTVDCDARVATVDQKPVRLSRLEFDLLQTLAAQPHRAFSHAELSQEVWGYDSGVAMSPSVVRTKASQLRQKLSLAGAEPLVQSVHGTGYRLAK